MASLKRLLRAVSGKKAVLLDLDNTLYIYAPCHRFAIQVAHRAFRQYKKVSFNTFLKKYNAARHMIHRKFKGKAFAHSRLHYFQIMLQKAGFAKKHAAKLDRIYWHAFFTKMKLQGWVRPFLEYCVKRGIKVVVVTNLTTALQKRKIKFFKLDKKIDYLLTSETAGVEKPHPKIFNQALRKVRIKANDAIIIGDDRKSDRSRFIDCLIV